MKTSNRNEIQEQLDGLAGEAIEVVRQLLRDHSAPQSVRLKAAKLILTACTGGGDDDEPVVKTILRAGPRLVPRAS